MADPSTEVAAPSTPEGNGPRSGSDRSEASSTAPDRGVRFWGLYPFELVTFALVGAAVVYLRWNRLRIDWSTVEYTIYPVLSMLPGALAAGVVLQLVYRLLRHRSFEAVRSYLRRIWSLRWLALWVRLYVAAMLMNYAYLWLKVSVPLLNEHLWDETLWALDVFLHAGLSPSIFVTQLFQDSPLAPLLDTWYAWWITSIFYAIAFFTAAPNDLFRRRFMLSCVLLWTLGSWIYLAIPALGPIYAYPQVWNDLAEQMPSARGIQALLWENYQRVLAGRTGVLRQFNPTRGIAAMPSLHVGAHGLFTLWVFRHQHPLRTPFLLATLLTFIASILSGWHYAVDGYAGLLLAWVCYRIARLAEPTEGRTKGRSDEHETPRKDDAPEPRA